MTVRSMTPAEIPAAAGLERECFAHPWSEDSFRSAFDTGTTRFFAAYDGETMTGYCGLQTAAGEGSVTNLAVSPAARRKGIGSALLAEMIRWAKARKLAALFLEVRPSNLPAIRMYEKAGFLCAGRRKGFYRDPAEDALIYTLNL